MQGYKFAENSKNRQLNAENTKQNRNNMEIF